MLMQDIKKIFNSSYNLIMRNKRVIFPVLCSMLIPFVLVLTFVQLSGFGPLFSEYISLRHGFDQQKTSYLTNTENIGKQGYGMELLNYLGRDNDDSTYNSELEQYLSEKGYDWNRYSELVNINNLVLLGIFILIGIISVFYFACMAQSLIALYIKKRDTKISSTLRVTNHFLLRYFGLEIAIFTILLAPIFGAVLLITIAGFFIPILAVILGIIFVFGILAYLILVSLKLFFVIQSMFLNDQGVISSIKQSFQMTKGNLKQVIILGFVVYGISLFINGLISQPLQSAVSGFFFPTGPVAMSISLMMIFFFMLLQAAALTFSYVFLFYSYTNFKPGNK